MIEHYTIKQLLDKFTLFVPEIQRDYVWGSDKNIIDVMIPFLQSLDNNLKGSNSYNIGFLYSYKNTTEDNYIIDGQQRFTTVILLLYVLAVHEGKDFGSYLRLNHPTMRFSYNVRPQTETFMRNLFRSHEVIKKSIVNQIWYMSDYDSDTSIMSMINAVDRMSSMLPDFNNVTFDKVLNYVGFWYFNVDETSQGEELYITMNSRGQKLTEAEQIKPHLFDKWQKSKQHSEDKTDYGKLWDEWEELFYSCARANEKDFDISAVDIAMNSFIRIVYEMVTRKECTNDVPVINGVLNLALIHRYIQSMRDFAQNEWPKLLATETDYRPLGVLKALISEGLKPKHVIQDTSRVERIFTNILTRRKSKPRHNDLLAFIGDYSESPSNLYDFILEKTELSEKVFDEHELSKIRIYKMYENQPEMQKCIELAFSAMESRKVWSGNIKPLIEWSLSREEDLSSFDFERFKNYSEKFDELFSDSILTGKDMDITRRALLAFRLYNYPRIFSGYTNISFAYDADDWHKLFLDDENKLKLKSFFDLYENKDTLTQLIRQFPAEEEYSDFVKIPELLDYCKQKKIQRWWSTTYLISGANANSAHANIHTYKYFLSRKEKFQFKFWKSLDFYHYGNSCVFLDCEFKNIAIDALWNGGPGNNQMAIEVFLRNEKEDKIREILNPMLDLEGLDFNWNSQKERFTYYFDGPIEEHKSFSLMDEKLEIIVHAINTMLCD